METKLLEALKESIEHWEKNAKLLSIDDVLLHADTKSSSCALCNYIMPSVNGCGKCPVKQDTGLISCQGTPYDGAANARMSLSSAKRYWDVSKSEEDKAFFRREMDEAVRNWIYFANEEVEFLKSLLPVEDHGEA